MKALRITVAVLAALLLAALALVVSLALWSGSSASLATSLEQLTRYLPAGQSLEVKDVKGTLRGGGSIGWLRWKRGELSVEASDVKVAWTLRSLLDGDLRLGQVAIKQLRIDDRRSPSAPTLPTDLRLPLRVDAPFSVDTMEWVGPPALQITGLVGHYKFDSKEHILDVRQAHISSGQYRGHGRLQAQAPMALFAQLEGSVQTTLPASRRPLMVQAHAELKGALAGVDAALALQASLLPELEAAPASKVKAKQAMQANVTARIQPWQAQPVVNAEASWQALDLAVLWPQAPQTRLDGEATVTPAGKGWQAGVKLDNSLSGPWNQRRLPVQSLKASVEFVAGQWTVKSLQASAAGGHIEAQGKLAGTKNAINSAQWQVSATLHGINPAALDSRLAATAMDGQVTAQQAPSGIAFDARLQAAAGNTEAAKPKATSAAVLAGLRLKTIQAQGLWRAPLLKLETLSVQADDAQLQGPLTFDTGSQAAEGRLALIFPGAEAKLEGQIASTRGQGDMSLRVTDAALASRWLTRLPGAPATLSQTAIQGEAAFTGHWQGGWQKQGQELQIQASLRAPKLDVLGAGQPADQAWRLRELQVDLSGTLRALSLSARGQAENASSHFELQAQARGGRVDDGLWQAGVDTAELTARSSLRPGSWTLRLSERLALDWKRTGTTQTLEAAAGSARLSGPVPGHAGVSWQAARWSQQKTGTEWRTQGSLQGLPLAWLDLLGQTQMANLGLRGDLLFGGQWDATGGETLRLRATLERTGGDLQLQTDSASAGTLQAGVRDARLSVTADGEQLAASLRWDSERAGQAQASFSTRLQRQDGAWRWPLDAPLAGTLRAQLPPVGAWSLLAPPGWRLRGTLDADAALSGTRGKPQWRGTLRAQDLALRSVVDGIDFSQGTLSASLNGERLDINEFTLQGAGGASGGRLSITGTVQWLASVGPAATTASRLKMELDATAQALRVSARADRRLVLSGKLTARLDEARLRIRGALKADQALFILPEDTAPQLGDDVLVRTVGPSPASTDQAGTSASLRVTPDVAVTLDLGPDFQVRGRGLVTRLAGSLELLSTAEHKLLPRLTGTVRTVGGTYKAYGQRLDIEEGELRFAGPFDNPGLNILAIRPNLQRRVGVQISGTALSPVVRLYAEPDLPEAEKLAWLVLGRSAANGGAETAVLQQAALALLGGKGRGLSGSLAEALGLDELSMRGSTANTDGSTTGATVMLGKRLSRNFYVAYERSLAGTLGTFYLFYDLSRRFTLRAQAGERSAVDLIFTIRYD